MQLGEGCHVATVGHGAPVRAHLTHGKPPQSINDFDRFIHGHKPVIKYMFLRFKDDPDLMTFASTVIPGGGRETGRRGQKRKAHPHRQPIGGAGAFGASKRQAAEDERMAKLLRAAAPPPDTRLAEALESQAKASQQAADTNLLFGLMDRHEKLVAAKSPLATLFEKKIERLLDVIGRTASGDVTSGDAAASTEATASNSAITGDDDNDSFSSQEELSQEL